MLACREFSQTLSVMVVLSNLFSIFNLGGVHGVGPTLGSRHWPSDTLARLVRFFIYYYVWLVFLVDRALWVNCQH
jgi:hypothetical protein